MANKELFSGYRGARLAVADRLNEAGGTAYSLDSRQALAQYAATGCLNGTFYASAGVQLEQALGFCGEVDAGFIAKTAVYARTKGHMKDLPALLCAVLSVRDGELLSAVFDRVIDTPKMLRNFVQIMRSGAVGRKSLGTLPKRLVLQWLANRTDEQLFFASIGNDPSLADILKMVHPKPSTPSRDALFGYLIGRPYDAEALPAVVREFEAFKRGEVTEVPDVGFQMLTGMPLSQDGWKAIARHASWQMTRMNLNTFARHGVFKAGAKVFDFLIEFGLFLDKELTELIAARLRDETLIRKSRVLPYQLMTACAYATKGVPGAVRDSLQEAMEIAISNVPKVEGRVIVFPDISGSMHSPVTGYRRGSSSVVRCVDVAALIAAAMLRVNRDTVVMPFESKAISPEVVGLNTRDSVMTNAERLASLPAGGTNCSAALAYVNRQKMSGDMVIYVSDNESWMDSPHYGRFGGGPTATMKEWALFKNRNPGAKMICIDIQPYGTTQAAERDDIINVGGFSDAVFSLIGAVASGDASTGYWVRQIQAIEI
jgi:60 kDa SS-A/Ro ribonucleoprotein